MAKFIVTGAGQIEMGAYEGDTALEAIDACCRDAGYKSESDMAEQLEQPSDLEATPL